jgi:hypothetical protein
MEDWGRLAHIAVELVDRLAILVALGRFPGMGVAGSRSLRSNSYARMHHFVRRTTFVPFRRFLGDVRLEFMQHLVLLFMVLWVPISATLCMRVVLTLWHAFFMFLGLSFFLFSSFGSVTCTAFSCKNLIIYIIWHMMG